MQTNQSNKHTVLYSDLHNQLDTQSIRADTVAEAIERFKEEHKRTENKIVAVVAGGHYNVFVPDGKEYRRV